MVDMLTAILPASWAFFATYLAWFVTSAKCSVAISFDDAKALWQIHKKNTNCISHKWRPVSRRKGKISGFECECGYRYVQKRPIISRWPKNSHLNRRSQTAFPLASD